jgi:hypothetical protein
MGRQKQEAREIGRQTLWSKRHCNHERRMTDMRSVLKISEGLGIGREKTKIICDGNSLKKHV